MIGVFATIRTFGVHVDLGNCRTLTRESRAFQIPFWRILKLTAFDLSQAFDSGLEAAFSQKLVQVLEQSHPDDLSDAEISLSGLGISPNWMAAGRIRRVVDPESRESEHFP